jgi:acetate kinase
MHRLRAEIAAMTAGLGGLDAVVFAGGVGERSAPVREQACDGLRFLGVQLDAKANARASGDADVTAPDRAVRVFVIAAREDLEIARQLREVIESAAGTVVT